MVSQLWCQLNSLSAQCAKLCFILEVCGLQALHCASSYNKTVQMVVGHAMYFVPEPCDLVQTVVGHTVCSVSEPRGLSP